MPKSVFEYRGVDNLVYAEVLVDTLSQFTTGAVKELSPVAEIGRTTQTSSEVHHYDNSPIIVINTSGADELKLTVAPLDLATYAEITGQSFNTATGTLIECEPAPKYYAIGYRTKGTDGAYRYVWRMKGKFGIPDETSATESDGVDTNNTELTWTGISTIHKFTQNGNKSAKAIVSDERYEKLDFAQFFESVLTPDTVSTLIDATTLPAPVIFPSASSTFTNSVTVSLVCEDGGATIRYTVDGTTPTSSSTEYTEPFEINATKTIKAIAIKSSMTSDVSVKTFAKITS